MPRATQSPASQVLHFFRTASLDAVDLVLDLSKDIVRERKNASTDTEPPTAAEPAAAPRRRAGRPKATAPATAGNGRRRRLQGPVPNEATPLIPPQETVGEDDQAADDVE